MYLSDIEQMESGSVDPVAVGIVVMSVMPLGEGDVHLPYPA